VRFGAGLQRFAGLCSIACAGLVTSLPANADRPGNQGGQTSASVRTLPGSALFQAPADVQQPPNDALQTASGIAMTILQSGSGGQHPGGDDCVIVKFTAWRRDGTLQATSGAHGEPALQCVSSMIPGASEAIQLMVPGERRRIWIPSDLAFSAHAHHHQEKGLPEEPQPAFDVTLDIELVRILMAPKRPLDLNNPPARAKRMPSGLAIEILKTGTGTTHPGMNSRVILNYTGWSANGLLFESTIMSGHPAAVLVGSALPGWREALPLMVSGEKVRIWVPADLAFGEGPFQATAPAGNLVYDIELVGIQ
jgi:FKBP-type peptidyl-prolyl cis-trans isomerase